MICFGQESSTSLDVFVVKCNNKQEICDFISASSRSSWQHLCNELPEVIEVIQKSPINLGNKMLSHQRFVGANMITVPGEIQQKDWLDLLRAGKHAEFLKISFPMHGTFEIPVEEFGKLFVTDNHMNYEQACMINEKGTIVRTHHDSGTQDSCWVHRSELHQMQGNFFHQCIGCRALFDGVNTISLLPAAPVPVRTNNIVWAEHNFDDSDEEDVDSDEEDVDSDEEDVVGSVMRDFRVISSQLQQCIRAGQQSMAKHHFDVINVNNRYNIDGIRELLQLTVQFNTMDVFDHIIPSYQNLLHNEFLEVSQVVLRYQQEFMSIALSNDSLPSTLLHLIRHPFFVNSDAVWLNSFSVLFHLPSTLLSLEEMLLRSEPVLSKLNIIVENGANPKRKNYDRYNYSGFDEFTEWCVYTNATDDTIHRGFNILLEYARYDNTVFDIVGLFTKEILRIICMNRHHTEKNGRPTINIQECSEKSSDSVLRMMIFFKTFLRFPIDQVDRDSDNVFFYTTKSEVVRYLIDKGVNPRHVGNNGECAVLGILRQIDYGTAVEEYTHEQVEKVRQCVSLLYSHNVGLDMATLITTLDLVRHMNVKNNHFQRLHDLVLISFKTRSSFTQDSAHTGSKR